jgi:hypothetical protein
MIDTDLRSTTAAGYAEPSLHELIDLARAYGILLGCEFTTRGVSLRMPHRHYDLTLDQGRLLVEGALAGYLLADSGANGTLHGDSAWRD